jgi:hypothetical protein
MVGDQGGWFMARIGSITLTLLADGLMIHPVTEDSLRCRIHHFRMTMSGELKGKLPVVNSSLSEGKTVKVSCEMTQPNNP